MCCWFETDKQQVLSTLDVGWHKKFSRIGQPRLDLPQFSSDLRAKNSSSIVLVVVLCHACCVNQFVILHAVLILTPTGDLSLTFT